ncbi:MAG: tetratricopeptide repeat protein [Elusimicrobia bacterium]|nr:tetratricopeptide repeat protein [Elusimicrobiota bacterium]
MKRKRGVARVGGREDARFASSLHFGFAVPTPPAQLDVTQEATLTPPMVSTGSAQRPLLPPSPRPASLLFLALFLCAIAAGRVEAGGRGTTGANFLKLGAGPRALAMGQAQAAVGQDAAGAYWNPASLAHIQSHEVSLMHTELVETIRAQYAAYANPYSPLGVFGGSVYFLSVGDLQGRDATGKETGKLQVYDAMASLTYATTFPKAPYLAVGITAKGIQERLAGVSATTAAGDFGAQLQLGEWLRLRGIRGLSMGFAVQNLGGKLRFHRDTGELPRNVRMGLGYRVNVFGNPLTLAMDLNVPNDNDRWTAVGAEYWIRQLLAFRVGWRSNDDLSNGLSYGVGIRVGNVGLDYALVNFGEFGLTHRAALSLRFGPTLASLRAEAAFKRGLQAYEDGRYPAAIVEFNKALEFNPNHQESLEMMRRANERLSSP